jgi:hypothetical protein
MAAAKHTPGPWVYELDDGACGNRPYITTVARCCDFVIGLRCDIAGGNYRDGDPSGDPEADARLIAAAAELLAELIDLRRQIHDFAKKYGEADFETGRAAAAIAKATGSAT